MPPGCTGECETIQGCQCCKRPACDCVADVEFDESMEPLSTVEAMTVIVVIVLGMLVTVIGLCTIGGYLWQALTQ